LKGKLEIVTNVVVIVLALTIGFVFVKDRFFGPALGSSDIKAGDRLAGPKGLDWNAHDRTLLMVLRKGCHYCEDSVPFYQRLVDKRKHDAADLAIVALFPDDAETARTVTKSESLDVETLGGVPLQTLRVSGTPALILVDRSGIVLNTWVGMLSPKQELDVMKATDCVSAGCT